MYVRKSSISALDVLEWLVVIDSRVSNSNIDSQHTAVYTQWYMLNGQIVCVDFMEMSSRSGHIVLLLLRLHHHC